MATVGNIIVNLLAGTAGFAAGMRQAQGMLEGFSNQITGIAGQIAAAVGVAGGIGSIGMGLKLAADAEQAETAMGVLLGSTQDAKKVLQDLTTFAATTPFEMPELQGATKQLLAFKTSQEELLPTLRMLGDVSSGLSIPLNDLVYVYGTVRAQGRAMTQDINQFAGRGVPIWDALSKQFGVSNSEIRKLVEQGKVGFPQIEMAFKSMTKEGGQFFGMTEKQSETFAGRMSTLRDAIAMTFRDMGQVLIDELDLKGVALRVAESAANMQKSFADSIRNIIHWFEQWGRTILTISTFVVSFTYVWKGLALVMLLINQRTKIMAALMAAVLALSNPLYAAVAAMAAAGAAFGVNAALDWMLADPATQPPTQPAEEFGPPAPPKGWNTTGIEPQVRSAEQAKKMAADAAKIIEDLRSPQERYRRDLYDLQKLMESGDLSLREYYGAVELLNGELDKATGGAKEQIKSLEEELQFIYEGDRALEAYRLKQKGAADADIARIQSLQQQIDSQKALKKAEEDRLKDLMARAKEAKEATLSPMDTFRKSIASLQELSNESMIDQQTFEAGILQARDTLADALRSSMPAAPGVALRGTSEAISAVNRSRREDEQLLTLKDLLEQSKIQTQIQRDRATAATRELQAVEL